MHNALHDLTICGGVVYIQFKIFNDYLYDASKKYFIGKKSTAEDAASTNTCKRYIYIFRKKENSVCLWSEILAKSDTKYQFYELSVPATNKLYRKLSRSIEDYVPLELNYSGIHEYKYYFLLSDFRLSGSRIELLRKQITGNNCPRVKEVKIIQGTDAEYADYQGIMTTIYLIDYYKYANDIHEKYILQRDNYLGLFNNKSARDKDFRYITDIVYEVCKEKDWFGKLRKHDNGQKIHDWLAGEEKKEKKEVDTYEKWAALLARWLSRPEFRAVCLDHEFAAHEGYSKQGLAERGEKLYAKCVERLSESRPGLAYLKKEYAHYRRIHDNLLGTVPVQRQKSITYTEDELYNACQEQSYLTFVFFATRRASQSFFEFVDSLKSVIIKWETEPIAMFKMVVYRRTLIELTTIDWSGVKKHWLMIDQYGEVNATVYKVTIIEKDRKLVKAIKKFGPAVQILIESINLGLAVKSLASKTSGSNTKEIIELGGAVLDFTSVLVATLTKQKPLAYALGCASGIVDAITYGWDAVNKFNESDYDAMAGYGVAALGSLTVAVGSFIAAGGVTTSATIVGIPVGVFLIVIGFLVVLAGVIIAFFCTDSDLEQWIKHCFWGSSYGKDDVTKDWSEGSYMSWIKDLQKQIKALHNILYRFQLEGAYYSQYENNHMAMINLEIKPSLIRPFNKITVNAFLDDFGAINRNPFKLSDKMLLSSKSVNIIKKDNKLNKLSVCWYDPENEYKATLQAFIQKLQLPGYPGKWTGVKDLRKGVRWVQAGDQFRDSSRWNGWLIIQVEFDLRGDGAFVKRDEYRAQIINYEDQGHRSAYIRGMGFFKLF